MTRGITAKKLARIGGILLLFLTIAGYGLWQGRDLLFGIRMRVLGIENGMRTTNSLLELSGVAKHGSGMLVNGRFVPVAESGEWYDTIALIPGENKVTIAAKDKFDRTTTKHYRVYYDTEAQN